MTAPSPPPNSLAAASLVLAFLLPPLGIALGLLALDEIGERGDPGAGLARAAVVVGCVLTLGGMLLVVLGAVLWALVLALSAGVIPWY